MSDNCVSKLSLVMSTRLIFFGQAPSPWCGRYCQFDVSPVNNSYSGSSEDYSQVMRLCNLHKKPIVKAYVSYKRALKVQIVGGNTFPK